MVSDKKNIVEFVSVGDKIFEAALKMTKFNMAWLRNQVCVVCKASLNLL